MKKEIVIWWFIFLCLYMQTQALQFCDWGDFWVECNGGTIHASIDTIESLTGSYVDISSGSFGTSYQWQKIVEEEWYIPVWFMGQSFVKNRVISEEYVVPVWFIGKSFINNRVVLEEYIIPVWYMGTDYVHHEKIEEINYIPVWYFHYYKGKNIVFPDSWAPESKKSWWWVVCNQPEKITDITVDHQKSKLWDILNISWENPHSTHVKIIKYGQTVETFFFEGNSYHEILDLQGDYVYYLVAYNDCYAGIFSDRIGIQVDQKNIKWPLMNYEILEIFWESQESLYFLNHLIDFEGETNYGDLSLIVFYNHTKIPFFDASYTFWWLQQHWVFGENKEEDDRLWAKDLLQIQQWLAWVDSTQYQVVLHQYALKKSHIIQNYRNILYRNKHIQNLEQQDFHVIEQCFSYQGCANLWLYTKLLWEWSFGETSFWGDVITSYGEVYEILLKEFSREYFIQYSLSEKQQNEIIWILIESLLNEQKDAQVDYFGYQRMNVLLFDYPLKWNLEVIIKNSSEILDIYNRYENKEMFLDILKEYTLR